MSAAALGTNLLQEVKEEGLNELLHTLRSIHEDRQRHVHTGQANIDELLNAFESSHRHHLGRDLTSVQHNTVRHQRRPVLELIGATPCSGKTQLLYHLVGLSLLPKNYEDVSLGGNGAVVILFDLRTRFSVLRLKEVMFTHVQSQCEKSSETFSRDAVVSMVRNSLDHLHVFRPQTSLSLLVTLSNLQRYLFSTASHVSANRSVGSIILHDVDAFLWQDRLEDAEEQTHGSTAPQNAGLLSSRFRDMVTHVRRIQTIFSCLVIATSSALSTTSHTRIEGHTVPVLKSHLPNSWRSFVTVRLIVQRDSVRKFPLGISAEEAAAEADQRREAVEKSIFSARLDWSESDVWREETRGVLKAMDDVGDFPFRITASGVDFDVRNQYRDQGRLTDLTIICNGHEFRCHKLIVCAQSSFFEAACTSGFQESFTSKIDLPDEDPYHVFLLLEFLYRQTYTESVHPDDDRVDFEDPRYLPKIHLHLFELGDKYDVAGLSRCAAVGFGKALDHVDLQDLFSCVRLIYVRESNVTQPLRGKIARRFASRFADIASNEQYRNRLVELVHENEVFREELLLAQLDKNTWASDAWDSPGLEWNHPAERRHFEEEVGMRWSGM
ncbi:MAG: hypothetical protein LQ348_006027 [Seirophora lacunosa]|nr:MAG: hypothetical protein LQ348_006027 [Seirophora lacunosa]